MGNKDKNRSLKSRFLDNIRSQDLFGEPVQVSQHRQKTMKTHTGGIVSIIIILGMLIYLHKKLQIVFTRGNTELS